MLFKAKTLYSAGHGKRKLFCILISRLPYLLRLLSSLHVEKANQRCLQCVTAQLSEKHLILINWNRENKAVEEWIFLLKTLADFLGSWDTNICLSVCTYPTSIESLSIPQLTFSHSSWHDCYATHIWKVFPFTAGERCLGIRLVTIKG